MTLSSATCSTCTHILIQISNLKPTFSCLSCSTLPFTGGGLPPIQLELKNGEHTSTKRAYPKKLNKTYQRVSAHLPLYHQQFSNPIPKGLTRDGNSDFFIFSTGRRNLASLHTIFTLRPRHDFLQILFQTARTLIELQYRPFDDLQLDFKLAPGTLNDNFVFAIVAKDELLSIKDSRWDLVMFEVPSLY